MKRVKELLEKMSSPALFSANEFEIKGVKGALVAAVNLCDSTTVLEILRDIKQFPPKKANYESLKIEVLQNLETTISLTSEEQVNKLLSGDGLLFLNGQDGCLVLSVRKYTTRAVAEPPTSGVIRGPREGFIEDIRTNLSLVERKLRSPHLKVERLVVGRRTATNVAIVYIEGIARKDLTESIYDKIRGIDIDGVLDTHYIQEFLDERPRSIFPQSGVSEKPDVIVSKMLEGRVAVFVDGSPMVATVPYLLLEELQSGEDYYERPTYISVLRIIRTMALALGILLPGLFVALQEFHVDVFPQKMMLTILNAVEGIPIPPFGEIMFVLFIFEIIREAGVRMPQAMGLAMSVVGALVLGDTAVKAGFMSSPAVMVVALSSISLYTVPGGVGTTSLLRLIFTLIGGIAGLYGLLIGSLFLVMYLCNLDNYGSPYLAPFAPHLKADFKDGLIKAPIVEMETRPKSIPNENNRRMSNYGQNKF